MSDELRLPDELAACEARLAAMPLPASRIDRDELMYRAGWVAGVETTRLAATRVTASKRSTASLCAASAALAASLAVAVTWQFRPAAPSAQPTASHLAHPQPLTAPDAGMDAVNPRPPAPPRIEIARAAMRPLGGRRLETGLIALRERMMSNDWPHSANVTASSSETAPPAQTARELMEELLPADSARQSGAWPWKSTSPGDSI